MLVKSEVSLFRSLAFLSISAVSLLVAYKLKKDHTQPHPLYKLPHPNEINFALNEGQTILAVKDTPKTMYFYFGEDREEKDYE
jgi:hypothetical protein